MVTTELPGRAAQHSIATDELASPSNMLFTVAAAVQLALWMWILLLFVPRVIRPSSIFAASMMLLGAWAAFAFLFMEIVWRISKGRLRGKLTGWTRFFFKSMFQLGLCMPMLYFLFGGARAYIFERSRILSLYGPAYVVAIGSLLSFFAIAIALGNYLLVSMNDQTHKTGQPIPSNHAAKSTYTVCSESKNGQSYWTLFAIGDLVFGCSYYCFLYR